MRETSGVFRLPVKLRFGGGEAQPLLLRAVAHKKPEALPHIKAKVNRRALAGSARVSSRRALSR
jgi:hypothetical protein